MNLSHFFIVIVLPLESNNTIMIMIIITIKLIDIFIILNKQGLKTNKLRLRLKYIVIDPQLEFYI